jgi:acyl-phosphate glycerol 3-phosphate acyltransferase
LELLYVFEKIRNPILDAFFSAVTLLGDEAAFIVMILVLFWCIDKRAGYYLSAVGFCGAILNLGLKMTFRVPRPWVLDPDFTIVESAREAATGYSFPSGHTQNAVGIYLATAMSQKRRWATILGAFAIVCVPISRMYLGVHTPWDVGTSFVLAIALALVLYPLFRRTENGGLAALVVLLIPAIACGAACMLGHIVPIFFGFKGGKGVATSVGIFAVCCPIAIIIGLIVFIALVIITRYVSLGSVVAATIVVILSIIFHNDMASVLPQMLLAVVMGAMVIGKHRENIKRLLNGTESKIKFGSKKND